MTAITATPEAARPRAFVATYTTHAGVRGTLTVLARSSCDAVIHILDALHDDVHRLSVRPA